MTSPTLLSPARQLTETESCLVWRKPLTHVESEAEQRVRSEVKRNWHSKDMKITNILLEGDAGSGKTQLAKALSADFGLPYTKITCFADMDKSDVLGSILPVLSQDEQPGGAVDYQFYPSEIVRAYENGWLLEIQEPTVIRDAAVLMALNSALEPDGCINLPTRIVHRHPDFIAVITTNRGYNGCRPLNEALRDRMHHTEKMDLPPKEVMMARAAAKTGYTNQDSLSIMADVIILLDKTAKANAIKGVAGMRSYLFWVDAVHHGLSITTNLCNKVLYKITTDPEELAILEQALTAYKLTKRLAQQEQEQEKQHNTPSQVLTLHLEEDGQCFSPSDLPPDPNAVGLQKSADSTAHTDQSAAQALETQTGDTGEDGDAIYHELKGDTPTPQQRQDFRKKLNQEARQSVNQSLHKDIKLIVHRPEYSEQDRSDYHRLAGQLMPVIQQLVRKTHPLLIHEVSNSSAKGQLYGTQFCADRLSHQDFRYFSRKRPPDETPSLAVALRIDESASMAAFGRIESAQQAAIALYEFCKGCDIPLLIYGDTADRSRLEQMSLYSYVDYASGDSTEGYSLMTMRGRSNNRDGMALRILSDRLLQTTAQTKLLISISDGQPKAMPDYSGQIATDDMKQTLAEYRRKGIVFLAAAIGQDKDTIETFYGSQHTLDISDLSTLPARLVQIITRYL